MGNADHTCTCKCDVGPMHEILVLITYASSARTSLHTRMLQKYALTDKNDLFKLWPVYRKCERVSGYV